MILVYECQRLGAHVTTSTRQPPGVAFPGVRAATCGFQFGRYPWVFNRLITVLCISVFRQLPEGLHAGRTEVLIANGECRRPNIRFDARILCRWEDNNHAPRNSGLGVREFPLVFQDEFECAS